MTSSLDNTARIWDASTGTGLQVLTKYTNLVFSASFSPCSKLVVTGTSKKTAMIWDASTGDCVQVLENSCSVWSASFSPCGRFVLSACEGKTARIWDVSTGACLQVLTGHTDSVRSASFSPCGRFVVTTSDDKSARIQDLQRKFVYDYSSQTPGMRLFSHSFHLTTHELALFESLSAFLPAELALTCL